MAKARAIVKQKWIDMTPQQVRKANDGGPCRVCLRQVNPRKPEGRTYYIMGNVVPITRAFSAVYFCETCGGGLCKAVKRAIMRMEKTNG